MLRRRSTYTRFRCEQGTLLYRTYGNGPPLLLIHGLSASGGWWRRNVGVFAQHFSVHVVELKGYGTNRSFRPLRIRAAADCLAALIASLPAGRAHVVGHSMGGHISVHLAAHHPECVDRLVLAGASGLVRGDLLRMALKLPQAARYSPLNFIPTLAYDALRSGPVNVLLSTLDILRDDTTEALAMVAAPTLLVWGEHDVLVPPALGTAAQGILKGSRLVLVERAGHNVMWDRPDEFNRVVLEFLLPEEPSVGMPIGETSQRPND
jgi:pimeloyl-ACP methyl ester carboxylesterase